MRTYCVTRAHNFHGPISLFMLKITDVLKVSLLQGVQALEEQIKIFRIQKRLNLHKM